MKYKIIYLLFFIPIFLLSQNSNIHHELSVKILPDQAEIVVVDNISVKASALKDKIIFTLNNALNLELLSENLYMELTRKSFSTEDIGMDRDDSEGKSDLLINEYSISGFDRTVDLKFSVSYSGKIESPISQSEENYQRGFSESPGIISNIGVYLAGSTYWIPTIENEFVTFELTTELPSIWRNVSQGKRTQDRIQDENHFDTWLCETPQEEIFLIAAKFNEYKLSAGAVDAYAFLRTPDEALANKYLETTAQYLEMYRKLIGPFPYSKFALVENFWETGYGMPSFTLLGEKIIRFPFILHSSYPHELLHNWWGNSVYVDFENGNWCEGLTAYMADHLIKEQRGLAEEYRRSTLQKFSDFVNSENDFPLSKFRSRYDGPSEAIGYGKALMVFHMLRMRVGDDKFTKAFQSFNRNNKFKKASYQDIQEAFEDVTGENLNWFFKQWVNRTGAPELKLSGVELTKSPDSYLLNFTIEQIQSGDPYVLDIPIVILDEIETHRKIFNVSKKVTQLSIEIKNKPTKIMVDPQYDLMRRLDSREIPPAFTKAYGSDETIMILPDTSTANYILYEKFVEGWIRGKEDKYTILNDSEIKEIPSDKTVWFLGKENIKLDDLQASFNVYDISFGSDSIYLNKKNIAANNNSFFVAVSNPKNIEQVVILLSIGNDKAVPGLTRKLPHYGKYSFLVFEGEEPTNIEKGQWPILNSPLIYMIEKNASEIDPSFEDRNALADLAPIFSSDRMMGHIKFLASADMKGRGLGTIELDSVAVYLAHKFKEYGLMPGGNEGSFYQTFEEDFPSKGTFKITNVIGIIPGTNGELSEPVVLSAHYDHLGLGWPDVRKGNEGKIHLGADDNASGVAVLLELAKTLGKSFTPARTIIFAAFSGEESGLLGSKYFVSNYKSDSTPKFLANLNFDTIGRLFEKKIMIINGNSAREWKFIFMGTEYTTGIPTELITQDLDASDQVSFISCGTPAVQFFSGPHEDYHKPEDIIEKIDLDGLVKVATVGKETIEYLGNRKELMSFSGKISDGTENKNVPDKATPVRSVSTGTMPDFSYAGKGVKVGAVSDGSPGAIAGLQKGDIIKRFNDNDIDSLKEYSDMLKKHSPGDKITFEIDREGKILLLELILVER